MHKFSMAKTIHADTFVKQVKSLSDEDSQVLTLTGMITCMYVCMYDGYGLTALFYEQVSGRGEPVSSHLK